MKERADSGVFYVRPMGLFFPVVVKRANSGLFHFRPMGLFFPIVAERADSSIFHVRPIVAYGPVFPYWWQKELILTYFVFGLC